MRRLMGLELDLPETTPGDAQAPFDFVLGLRLEAFRAEPLFLPGDLALEGANLPRDCANPALQSSPNVNAQLELCDLCGDLQARAGNATLESHRFLGPLGALGRLFGLQLLPLLEPTAVKPTDSSQPFEHQPQTLFRQVLPLPLPSPCGPLRLIGECHDITKVEGARRQFVADLQ